MPTIEVSLFQKEKNMLLYIKGFYSVTKKLQALSLSFF